MKDNEESHPNDGDDMVIDQKLFEIIKKLNIRIQKSRRIHGSKTGFGNWEYKSSYCGV